MSRSTSQSGCGKLPITVVGMSRGITWAMMPQPAPLLTLDRNSVVFPTDGAIGHLERHPAAVRRGHHEDPSDRSAEDEQAHVVEADCRGAHGIVDAPVGPGQPVELPPHAPVR